jgi:transposase InsO family protein
MIYSIHDSTGHSIRLISQTLQIPRSSYYHAVEPTRSEKSDTDLAERIKAIFWEHKRRYGYRRICEELADNGHPCAPARVRRLMKQHGLVALQPKSYKPQTSDGRADAPSPNLLKDELPPDKIKKINQVWIGDITYVCCGTKWLYLAVVMDLYSRRVLGWALADHLRSSLVEEAMLKALKARQCPTGLIFHSDRGSQYGSRRLRTLLKKAGIRQSMSGRANPYDNATMESFMGTFKAELVQDGSFIEERDAQIEISEYIDYYYNTKRKHSSIGYKNPNQFGADLTKAA